MKKNDQIFYSDIKMLQAMKYMYNYYCDVRVRFHASVHACFTLLIYFERTEIIL